MTTNFNESANTFSGEIHLYSSDVLQLFAGKKITSATPCSELTARNNKKYPGIVVTVEGVALKVGFLPWEVRCLSVQHYPKDNEPTTIAVDSLLSKAVMDSLLACNGNVETYYKGVCDKIVGKISGYHLSTGLNSQTKKTYGNYTWIVVDDASKAIVDITKVKEEKKEA